MREAGRGIKSSVWTKSPKRFEEEGETNRNFITLPHEAKQRSIDLASYKKAGATDLLEGGVYAPETADGWRMRIMSSP